MTNVYPHGKEYIFTIFDDTDVSTLGNIKPVYDLLCSLGMRTTKTVWPLRCEEPDSDFTGSATLEDNEYAKYIKKLADQGFEIAFHGATMESSPREKILEALMRFKEVVGYYPRSYACHGKNIDNLYWGNKRFHFGFHRCLYRFLEQSSRLYLGDVMGSPYFWGDTCRTHIDYVRTFTYCDLNLLNICDSLPYFSPWMPYMNACFFSAEANNVEEFNALLSPKRVQKLIKEKGVCILTVHFGKGFVEKGKLNPRSRYILENIADTNGWFMPVAQVLDFLRSRRKNIAIKKTQLFLLESKWFIHAFRRRRWARSYKKTELDYLKRSF